MKQTFKAIIVDDEEDGRLVLQSLIQSHCPSVEIIKQCKSAAEGEQAINSLEPDIVFLDINMPNANGFALLDKVKKRQFNLIFVTAYHNYAIRAIKYSALDYLMKPIDEVELKDAVNRCSKPTEENSNTDKINHFIDTISKDQFEKVILPVREGYVFVKIDDILRCEADSNYTTLYLVDGEKHIVSKTLKDFESQLSSSKFFRIHKSHLINLSYLKKYTRGDGGVVTLIDNTELDVSRRNKEEFLKALNL